MDKKELVTVIIVAYNQENFVGDCIQSVMNQTYSPIQLIICDDCSTDGTRDKINSRDADCTRRFEIYDKVFNEVNIGISATLNRALKLVRGKYVKTIAGDDALTRNGIDIMHRMITMNCGYDVVVSNGYVVKESFKLGRMHMFMRVFYHRRPEINDHIFEKIYQGNYIFAPGVMTSASLYDRIGRYDESFAFEDYDFNMRWARERVKAKYINIPLVYYRRNRNSYTTLLNCEEIENKLCRLYIEELRIIEKYKKEFEYGIYKERRNNFDNRYTKMAEKGQLIKLKSIISSAKIEENETFEKFKEV